MTITAPATVPSFCQLWGTVGPRDYQAPTVPVSVPQKTPQLPATAVLVRRVDSLVTRVRLGTMRASVAQRTVEGMAHGLPVEVYDMAIDSLLYLAGDEPLAPVAYSDADVARQRADSVDARTRRERRRAARLYARGEDGTQHAHNVLVSAPRSRQTAGHQDVLTYRTVWVAGTELVASYDPVTRTGQRVVSVPAMVTPTTLGGRTLPAVPALTPAERRAGARLRSRLGDATVGDAVETVQHVDSQVARDMASGDAWA